MNISTISFVLSVDPSSQTKTSKSLNICNLSESKHAFRYFALL